MSSANFQDWEPVVLKKTNVQKQINTQNQPGFKEYIKLVEDDIPTKPPVSKVIPLPTNA